MDSGTQCDSLLACFASILYYGIPSGGQLVQFITLTESDWANSGYLTAWLVSFIYYYKFLFYIIILLYIIDWIRFLWFCFT